MLQLEIKAILPSPNKYFQILDEVEILKAILDSQISDEIASQKQLSDVENANSV